MKMERILKDDGVVECLQNTECALINIYDVLMEINKTLKRFDNYVDDLSDLHEKTKK